MNLPQTDKGTRLCSFNIPPRCHVNHNSFSGLIDTEFFALLIDMSDHWDMIALLQFVIAIYCIIAIKSDMLIICDWKGKPLDLHKKYHRKETRQSPYFETILDSIAEIFRVVKVSSSSVRDPSGGHLSWKRI